MVISLFTSSAIFYLAIISLTAAMLLASNITFSALFKNIRPFILLALITAVYHLVFSGRDTSTLVEFYGIRVAEGGLSMAISFSLRVLVFIGIAFFVSLTTMPSDMAEALVSWLKPIGKLGVPLNDLKLVIFISMRFIPVLAEEFDTIRKAQIVRGVDFSGNIFKRSRKMVSLLIPVFHSAIRRADDLALAIESRGYVSGAARSSYHRFEWHISDSIFLLISVSIVVMLFIITGI